MNNNDLLKYLLVQQMVQIKKGVPNYILIALFILLFFFVFTMVNAVETAIKKYYFFHIIFILRCQSVYLSLKHKTKFAIVFFFCGQILSNLQCL